jgi:FkbM family methyltransferase
MKNKALLQNLSKGINKRISKIFSNPYKVVNVGWLKLKYLKHLPAEKLRKHELFGSMLYYFNPQELLHGFKEIFIEELYRINISQTPFIIDCGANIGLSVIYLKKKYPKAKVIAFEPDEKNFDLLQRNTIALTDVELKKEAVWIENTYLNFISDGSMSSKINLEKENSQQVKAIRLKDYLNKKVDFLKIDIEGAEYRVLKDISEKLTNVENLFLEYHGNFNQNDELVEIFEIISKSGFQFYIKEAVSVFDHPFLHKKDRKIPYDVQLNIFCFRLPNLKIPTT